MATFTAPIKRRNYGRGHGYRDANGLKVPGVTTIMSAGLPKHLENWAAETVAADAVDHWDELAELTVSERYKRLSKAHRAASGAASARGTKVHALATGLVAGDEVIVPDELAAYVDSYVQFLDEWDPAPIAVEAACVSYRHGYAGTFDLLADVPTLGLGILDIKVTKAVYGDVALQLAGYRYCDVYLGDKQDDGTVPEYPMPETEFAAVIHVRQDGYDLVPIEAGPEQHRVLLYVAQVAAFKDTDRELVGEPLTPPRKEVAA